MQRGSTNNNFFKEKVKLKSSGTTKPWLKEKKDRDDKGFGFSPGKPNNAGRGGGGGGQASWMEKNMSPVGKEKPASVGSTTSTTNSPFSKKTKSAVVTPTPPKNTSVSLDRREKKSSNKNKSKGEDVDRKAHLLNGALGKLKDKKKYRKQVEDLVERIITAQHSPQRRRRLSLRDNDIVTSLNKVIMNDPSVTEIKIEDDPRFKHIDKSLLLEFAEAIRASMHLRTLSMKGCELDNCFLSALAASIESNFTLETIILSNNAFTSDALVEFCQALGVSETVKKVDLREQNSPILTTSDDTVIEALRKNRHVEKLRIDVKSSEVKSVIKAIVARNKDKPVAQTDDDMKLIEHLEKEANRAEELQKHRQAEARVLDDVGSEDDWGYLYELSELANKYKLSEQLDGDNKLNSGGSKCKDPGCFSSRQDNLQKMLGPAASMTNFTSDGEFLNEEFISSFLVDDAAGGLTFAFQSQTKLFKRFPIGDSKRKFISKKFADTLLDHPRSKDITHINMANCGCGNEWLVRLCEKSLKKDQDLLPKLHLINIETNFVTEAGVVALSKCIACPDTWKYLQAVKLDNQRHMVSSRAELELAKALCHNQSVIRFSFRVRNLWERDQINKFVARNMDYLRQARLKHAIKTGTQVQRARNMMEQLFDKVAANDPSITEVEITGNQLFLSLPRDEVLKAGRSFANNTNVKSVQMTLLKLDDGFASALAESLKANSTIEKLVLDSNMIGSPGIMAVIGSLSRNSSIVELQLRHQSKPILSADEGKLAGLLSENTTVTKLGIDLRGSLPKIEVDRKLSQNREIARKARCQQNKQKASSKLSPTTPKASNAMVQFFHRVAANDPSITKVEVTGNQLFMSLPRDEVLKAGRSFANNTHVKSVRMTMLKLGDDFASALAESLEVNSTIEKLVLDSNMIGSPGIMAVIGSLSRNSSIVELQLRHQSKPIGSADEGKLAGLLSENTTITKLGIDLRGSLPKIEVDRKLSQNREIARKARCQQNKQKASSKPLPTIAKVSKQDESAAIPTKPKETSKSRNDSM